MMRNTYWNGNGELQNEYNEMLQAEKDGTFTFTKAALNEFHRYYRYYNDGDLPGWARGNYGPTRYNYKEKCSELTEKGEQILESRATERIRTEWKRYTKKMGR